jgi:glutamate synthase (NADPH) large chain
VVVLGRTGRNFAAGMSGGIAYVWDRTGNFESKCNREMVGLEKLEEEDVKLVQGMLRRHLDYTGSLVAENILKNWGEYGGQFVKVMPIEYKKALESQKGQAQPVAVA